MKRLSSFSLASLLLGAIVFSLHRYGGVITITWQDYQVETTSGILFFLLTVSVVVIKLSANLLHLLLNWRKYHQKRHRNKIPEEILSIFLALERGLPKLALEKAKFVQKYSPVQGLGEYFEAMALMALNDDEQAKIIFKVMTTYKKTEYLGWQGLARLSLKNDRPAQVLAYTEKALQYFPHSPWALKTVSEQAQVLGDYTKAEHALEQLRRLGYLEETHLKEKKSALLTNWAKSLESQHAYKEALSQARKAYRLHPGVEEGKILAELHVKLNHRWRAQFLIKRLWNLLPSEDLLKLYLQTITSKTALETYEAIQKLTSKNQDDEVSLIALAEAAHKAQLWGATEEYINQLARVTKDSIKVGNLEEKLSKNNPFK